MTVSSAGQREDPAVIHTPALVIGAGPAGLAVGACLRRAGVPFHMVEAGDQLGMSWHTRYQRLRLHTVKRYSALPYMSFPPGTPRYPSRQQVIGYLEAYAERFDLRPALGRSVTSTRFGDGQWCTQTPGGAYLSRYLIVCTGVNRQPVVPIWGGEDVFRGTIVHSAGYRNAEPFRGQRVLVVGMGNSGAEIALDLCQNGVETSIAVRAGVNVVPRDPLGVPIQVLSIFAPSGRPQMTDTLMRPLWRRLLGDLRPLGLLDPAYGPAVNSVVLGKIPVIDVGTVRYLRDGQIRVRGKIDHFTADGVSFADGGEEPFDAVVLATGFHPAIDSYLAGAENVTDERGYPLQHGRRTALPGLYFCGFHNVATGLLREIGREARQIGSDIGEQESSSASRKES